MSVVAVVGASGFVGSVLVERLWAAGEHEVRPLIHSTGSAGRLARHARPLSCVDVMVRADVERAFAGCSHVVNCSRGSTAVMDVGLKHMLDVSLRQGVKRFVHLSSSAVYGSTFDRRTVVTEDAPVRVTTHSYGWKKMKQDERIRRAVRRGLPCVTLCPPNIAGPGSGYLLEVVGALRSGGFAYVDGGRMPCDLVDVENLAHAITLALTGPVADGRRLFVTNGESTTWGELVEALAPLAGVEREPRSLTLDDARRLCQSSEPRRPSLSRALGHLVSSDVRSALAKDALFASLQRQAKAVAGRLPTSVQARLRGPDPDARLGRRQAKEEDDSVYLRLVLQQLRNAHYAIDRARRTLGYEPVVSFARSTDAFTRWYAAHTGYGTRWWPLLRDLYSRPPARR